MFHVSQLRRYILDPSHLVHVDDVQVKDNLTVEASPLRIEDREVKKLRDKEITFMKVAWEGPADGNVTWELRIYMKDSYPNFLSNLLRYKELQFITPPISLFLRYLHSS